jgi:excisionase family DNA binding protein
MQLATIKEVSSLLQVKTSTIYSWVHNGTIPFHKLNGLVRFDLDEIETWVMSSRPVSASPALVPTVTSPGIDSIIRKAIDGSKGKGYNPSNGKPGHIQGLRKE